jgi:hypothetical protein
MDQRDTSESWKACRSPVTHPDLSCLLWVARHFVSFPCGAWQSYCQTLAAFSSGHARSVDVSQHEVSLADCPGEAWWEADD